MKILIIRRDNIGDMVCTTPLIAGISEQLKPSRLDILTNSYVAPILRNWNWVISNVFEYQKAKHTRESRVLNLIDRIRLILRLRQTQYDVILSFDPRASRLARLLRFKKLLTRQSEAQRAHLIGLHEVEQVWMLGDQLGLKGSPGPLFLQSSRSVPVNPQLIGVHFSARRPTQRLTENQVLEVIAGLSKALPSCQIRLFWSPGGEENPLHPGDDQKASKIREKLDSEAVELRPTATLGALIDEIEQCSLMIMADGGAMHVAAALGKPICALFAESNEQGGGRGKFPIKS